VASLAVVPGRLNCRAAGHIGPCRQMASMRVNDRAANRQPKSAPTSYMDLVFSTYGREIVYRKQEGRFIVRPQWIVEQWVQCEKQRDQKFCYSAFRTGSRQRKHNALPNTAANSPNVAFFGRGPIG
jgi:hypothetical protein